jgi:hypothetical protein
MLTLSDIPQNTKIKIVGGIYSKLARGITSIREINNKSPTIRFKKGIVNAEEICKHYPCVNTKNIQVVNLKKTWYVVLPIRSRDGGRRVNAKALSKLSSSITRNNIIRAIILTYAATGVLMTASHMRGKSTSDLVDLLHDIRTGLSPTQLRGKLDQLFKWVTGKVGEVDVVKPMEGVILKKPNVDSLAVAALGMAQGVNITEDKQIHDTKSIEGDIRWKNLNFGNVTTKKINKDFLTRPYIQHMFFDGNTGELSSGGNPLKTLQAFEETFEEGWAKAIFTKSIYIHDHLELVQPFDYDLPIQKMSIDGVLDKLLLDPGNFEGTKHERYEHDYKQKKYEYWSRQIKKIQTMLLDLDPDDVFYAIGGYFDTFERNGHAIGWRISMAKKTCTFTNSGEGVEIYNAYHKTLRGVSDFIRVAVSSKTESIEEFHKRVTVLLLYIRQHNNKRAQSSIQSCYAYQVYYGVGSIDKIGHSELSKIEPVTSPWDYRTHKGDLYAKPQLSKTCTFFGVLWLLAIDVITKNEGADFFEKMRSVTLESIFLKLKTDDDPPMDGDWITILRLLLAQNPNKSVIIGNLLSKFANGSSELQTEEIKTTFNVNITELKTSDVESAIIVVEEYHMFLKAQSHEDKINLFLNLFKTWNDTYMGLRESFYFEQIVRMVLIIATKNLWQFFEDFKIDDTERLVTIKQLIPLLKVVFETNIPGRTLNEAIKEDMSQLNIAHIMQGNVDFIKSVVIDIGLTINDDYILPPVELEITTEEDTYVERCTRSQMAPIELGRLHSRLKKYTGYFPPRVSPLKAVLPNAFNNKRLSINYEAVKHEMFDVATLYQIKTSSGFTNIEYKLNKGEVAHTIQQFLWTDGYAEMMLLLMYGYFNTPRGYSLSGVDYYNARCAQLYEDHVTINMLQKRPYVPNAIIFCNGLTEQDLTPFFSMDSLTNLQESEIDCTLSKNKNDSQNTAHMSVAYNAGKLLDLTETIRAEYRVDSVLREESSVIELIDSPINWESGNYVFKLGELVTRSGSEYRANKNEIMKDIWLNLKFIESMLEISDIAFGFACVVLARWKFPNELIEPLNKVCVNRLSKEADDKEKPYGIIGASLLLYIIGKNRSVALSHIVKSMGGKHDLTYMSLYVNLVLWHVVSTSASSLEVMESLFIAINGRANPLAARETRINKDTNELEMSMGNDKWVGLILSQQVSSNPDRIAIGFEDAPSTLVQLGDKSKNEYLTLIPEQAVVSLFDYREQMQLRLRVGQLLCAPTTGILHSLSITLISLGFKARVWIDNDLDVPFKNRFVLAVNDTIIYQKEGGNSLYVNVENLVYNVHLFAKTKIQAIMYEWVACSLVIKYPMLLLEKMGVYYIMLFASPSTVNMYESIFNKKSLYIEMDIKKPRVIMYKIHESGLFITPLVSPDDMKYYTLAAIASRNSQGFARTAHLTLDSTDVERAILEASVNHPYTQYFQILSHLNSDKKVGTPVNIGKLYKETEYKRREKFGMPNFPSDPSTLLFMQKDVKLLENDLFWSDLQILITKWINYKDGPGASSDDSVGVTHFLKEYNKCTAKVPVDEVKNELQEFKKKAELALLKAEERAYTNYGTKPYTAFFYLINEEFIATVYDLMLCRKMMEFCYMIEGVLNNTTGDTVSCERLVQLTKYYDAGLLYHGNKVSRPSYIAIFEITAYVIISKKQYEILNELIKDVRGAPRIHQAIMGLGKTTVLIPAIVLYCVLQCHDTVKNVVVIQPEHLVDQTIKLLRRTLGHVLNPNYRIMSLCVTRDSTYEDFEDLILINQTKKNVIAVMSDTSFKTMYLRARTQTLSVDDAPVDVNWDGFKKNNVLIMDEIDSMYNPLNSDLNFPYNRISHPLAVSGKAFTVTNSTIEPSHGLIVGSVLKNETETVRFQITEVGDEGITIIPTMEEFGSGGSATVQSVNESFLTSYYSKLVSIVQDNLSELSNLNIYTARLAIEPIKDIVSNEEFLEKLAMDLLSLNTQRINLNYGLAPNEYLALPYSAVQTPMLGSKFSNIDLTAIFTIHSFLYGGLREEDMGVIQKIAITVSRESPDLQKVVLGDFESHIKKAFGSIKGFANARINKQNLKLEDMWKDVKLISTYLTKVVLPTYLSMFTQQENISFMDVMVSDCCQRRVAFSGTATMEIQRSANKDVKDNQRVFSQNVNVDPVANGAIETAVIGRIEENNIINSSVEEIIKFINGNEYRALIDCGAWLKEKKSEEVAQFILLNNTSLNTVVYVDETNQPMMFTKKDNVPVRLNNSLVKPDSTDIFYYFDQKHTIGTDLPQPLSMRGLCTITKDLRLTPVVQGIYRLRRLNYGQQVDFAIYDSWVSNTKELFDHLKSNEGAYIKSMKPKQLLQNIKLCVRQTHLHHTRTYSEDKYYVTMYKSYKDYLDKLLHNASGTMCNELVEELCLIRSNDASTVILEKEAHKQKQKQAQQQKESGVQRYSDVIRLDISKECIVSKITSSDTSIHYHDYLRIEPLPEIRIYHDSVTKKFGVHFSPHLQYVYSKNQHLVDYFTKIAGEDTRHESNVRIRNNFMIIVSVCSGKTRAALITMDEWNYFAIQTQFGDQVYIFNQHGDKVYGPKCDLDFTGKGVLLLARLFTGVRLVFEEQLQLISYINSKRIYIGDVKALGKFLNCLEEIMFNPFKIVYELIRMYIAAPRALNTNLNSYYKNPAQLLHDVYDLNTHASRKVIQFVQDSIMKYFPDIGILDDRGKKELKFLM